MGSPECENDSMPTDTESRLYCFDRRHKDVKLHFMIQHSSFQTNEMPCVQPGEREHIPPLLVDYPQSERPPHFNLQHYDPWAPSSYEDLSSLDHSDTSSSVESDLQPFESHKRTGSGGFWTNSSDLEKYLEDQPNMECRVHIMRMHVRPHEAESVQRLAKQIFAMKSIGHDRYEHGWQQEALNLFKLGQPLTRTEHHRSIALDGCSSKHRIARIIPPMTALADNNVVKGGTTHLEQEYVMIELMERGRWTDHLRNLAVSLGQICAAYPMVLYQPVRYTRVEKLLNQQNSNLQLHLVGDLILQYWKCAEGSLSSLLPTALANRMNDPSPSLFLASSLLLAILVNAQCQYNRGSVFRKPFLAAAVILTLLLNIHHWYVGGIPTLSGTAMIALTTILAALISSQIADTAKRCFEGRRSEMERAQSVLKRLHVAEAASCVKKG